MFAVLVNTYTSNQMGQSKSKLHHSNNVVNAKEQAKDQIVTNRVKQIHHLQNNTAIAGSQLVQSSNNRVDGDLLQQMLPDTLNLAEKQLTKKGANLTKLDLITIIIALEPNNSDKIYQLNSLTVSDLNFMIRAIIYDTDRYIMSTTVASAPPPIEATACYVEPEPVKY
jgi:hypothetical protein